MSGDYLGMSYNEWLRSTSQESSLTLVKSMVKLRDLLLELDYHLLQGITLGPSWTHSTITKVEDLTARIRPLATMRRGK